jgi:hypothetical protein
MSMAAMVPILSEQLFIDVLLRVARRLQPAAGLESLFALLGCVSTRSFRYASGHRCLEPLV